MKNKSLINLVSFLIALFCVVSFGFSQSIFNNPITGPDPGLTSPYTIGQIPDPNITVTGISRGPDLAGRSGDDRYNARAWNSASLNLNDYFEFALTPNSGYEIDFVNFTYSGSASVTGPVNFAFRSSLDGYTANIGTPTAGGTAIDLSAAAYQGVSGTITFRIYGWGASSGLGTFSIDDFTFNGSVNALGTCTSVSTWDGTSWDVAPSATAVAVLNGNYNAVLATSFSACSLQVNSGFTLTVGNSGFVEVENDVVVDGNLIVETEGNFVQRGNTGTFTNNGTSRVNKTTATKADWFYYTYWSSPVTSETIGSVFPDVDGDRRFWFNAANFVDNDGDDIDDNGDDWQPAYAADAMTPGVGYAITESRFFFGGAGTASFEGAFNTGDITTNIGLNGGNSGVYWNFIGNPYPSAMDFLAFHAANTAVVSGAAYFWSQATPPAESNPGNQQSNFSKSDYATYTVGSGGVAGASGVIPSRYIPSGQGFFIIGKIIGTATFTNAMRMADTSSNSLFFKGSNKSKTNNLANRLWLNLTTESGVFGQILLAYVEGATNDSDGLSYDAPKVVSEDYAAVLYSTMDSNNNKYVIQGRDTNSLNADEIVNLGFSSSIQAVTEYKLSIAQFEGEFFSNNPVYIKDNLLNELHDLSVSDYTFTSEAGTFNDRFEIVYSANALSTSEFDKDLNSLSISELEYNQIQFTASSPIKSIQIFDLLGRPLYKLEGNSNQETYKLSNINSAIFIAKVELLNGAIITKKAFKK